MAVDAVNGKIVTIVDDLEQAEKVVSEYTGEDIKLPNTIYCDMRTEKYHIYVEKKEEVIKNGKLKYKKIKPKVKQ